MESAFSHVRDDNSWSGVLFQHSTAQPLLDITAVHVAQKSIVGFVDHMLEQSFQRWYVSTYLSKVDCLSLVVCAATHVLVFLPMIGGFGANKLATWTWSLSLTCAVMFLVAQIRAKRLWLHSRRPLLITRRLIVVLLYRQCFSVIRSDPPTSWQGVFKGLLINSGAMRLAIYMFAIPDIVMYSAPFGLLALFVVSPPATAALCAPSYLGSNDVARDIIQKLHSYLMEVPRFLEDGAISAFTASGPYTFEEQCTQVVHASQIVVGIMLPLVCLYALEAFCRRRFLCDEFGEARLSTAGSLGIDFGCVFDEMVKGVLMAALMVTVAIAAEMAL